MASVDWTGFADKLNREREALQEKMPEGVKCFLSLDSYGFGLPEYRVSIVLREFNLSACGNGRTPAKAAAEAMKEFQKQAREQRNRPRMAAAEEVKALPAAARSPSLFD